ncbi:MAG: putative ATP-dependent RNA helicase [Candidatus Methanoperedens nitroreducens]|uniref:Putative ATP-dependent RNA helicase n=1 Tax=Candidatus Methanoperedens nitratireducens TaxID=1392998 RepID=A0A0P8CFK4_9EURY|nr:MAG: putative ATP-dependent RNA helicase [Candidatus Methanoperedens sp. BLZ1]
MFSLKNDTIPHTPDNFETIRQNNNQFLSPGSIIKNHSRLWRVDEVSDDVLTATSIDGGNTIHRRFLIPLEDIKPGNLEAPNPEIIGNISAQDLMLRAFKLSMLHGTAPLMSLQRSRVIPTQYQLVPVVMSLEMPKVRMLIADDVGLGKTIEAGLIITELLGRQQATRLLVICPANLREQWQEALEHFFHIDAKIISTRHRREMERLLPPGTNPWEYYPFLITSLDYAKMPQIKVQILELNWDIVLIDEAHNVAKPHQASAEQKIKMDRWELAEAISKIAKHLLLLTATPHNGYTDTYASLIRMLNVDAVSGLPHEPIINRDIAKSYICQRRRKDVEDWFKKSSTEKSPFPERDQNEIYRPLSDAQRISIEKVDELGNYILNVAEKESAYRRRLARWVVMHFHKRSLSSPRALVLSLENRLRKYEEKKKIYEEGEEDSAGITEDDARANVLDHDTGEKTTDEETGSRSERITFGDKAAQEREVALLKEVLEYARKVTPAKDNKLQDLLENQLRERLKTYPRVIIFTRYKDTLDYLEGNIKNSSRYRDIPIITIDGSLNELQRKEKFKDFESSKTAILIATDCISEGINLQAACNQLIHYELPWNPNRLEQRNGRIDRYGQKESKVYIRTLVMKDTLEAAILKILVQKADQIRKDYGFSPPFFGDDVSVLDLIREKGLQVNVGQRTLDDFYQAVEVKKGSANPFSDESIQKIKSESFYGKTEIDLVEVQQKLKETERAIGSSEQIEHFVRSSLNKLNCTLIEKSSEIFNIEITDNRLKTRFGNKIENATFNPKCAFVDPSLEVIDLGHSLVRQLTELVKQSTFVDSSSYGRTATMKTDAVKQTTALYNVIARYVVQTRPVSIIEEIIPIAVVLYGENVFSRDEKDKLISAKPISDNRTAREKIEDLKEALGRCDLTDIILRKLKERLIEISRERKTIKERLEKNGTQDWLSGLDNLTLGSNDLLSVTLYYPAQVG